MKIKRILQIIPFPLLTICLLVAGLLSNEPKLVLLVKSLILVGAIAMFIAFFFLFTHGLSNWND